MIDCHLALVLVVICLNDATPECPTRSWTGFVEETIPE
jgi:hypothetical protein